MNKSLAELLLRAGMAAQRRWNIDLDKVGICFRKVFRKYVFAVVKDEWPMERIELEKFGTALGPIWLGFGPRSNALMVFMLGKGKSDKENSLRL